MGIKSILAIAGIAIVAGGVGAAVAFGDGPRGSMGGGMGGGMGGHHGGWHGGGFGGGFGGRHAMGPFGHRLGHRLKMMDADKDGAITFDEATARRMERFNEFDTNKDGIVDEAELKARIQARVERIMLRLKKRFDRNKDGKVTKDEFLWLAKERFAWHDLNDDGKITRDELPRFMRRGWRH